MNVLIADDDPISRILLERHLQKWGCDVVAAQNGAEAWELFQQGEFPIVISDWMMPEMDGLELIRHIRSAKRSGYVYTILVTARSQKEDLVEGMETGADDFLAKPFDPGELRVRLREGERIIRLEQDLAAQNLALREAQAALVQSEKLASLGQLAAGMAHEINNPLAYVTNNLAVLQQDAMAALRLLDWHIQCRPTLADVDPVLAAEGARLEADADLAYLRENLPRLFQASQDGLKRVRDIVKNLRDFARLDEAELKAVDLNAAVQSTLEVLRHEIKQKELRLETRFGPPSQVQCHPGKINQVFLNILLNAVQASETGGAVEVRTLAEPGAAVVEIEDHGSGIAPHHLPHLFEPFFTTRPVGQGVGLGLSIAYGIVRDHGGSIEVQSQVGRGSTFRVRIPLRRPENPAAIPR